LNQEDINSLSRSLTSSESEAVVVSSQENYQDQMYSLLNFTTPLKNTNAPQPVPQNRNSQISFCKASVTLTPTPDKYTTKKENFRPKLLRKIQQNSTAH
jgi:hypothetical protein